MLGKLDQYILKNFFIALGFFAFALVGMFWIGQSVILIDQVVLRGESATTFFDLSLKLLPSILVNVIPIAALGATLYFLNLLASHGELVVITAAGRSPMRLLPPVMIGGICLSIVLMICSLYLAPKFNHDLRYTLRNIEVNFSSNVILGGRFVFPVENVTIFANESLNSGEMVDIFIEDRREFPLIRSYFAKQGILQIQEHNIHFALIDGSSHEHDLKTGAVSEAKFSRSELNLPRDEKPLSLSYWTNEIPTQDLIKNVKNGAFSHAEDFGELINRIFYPCLSLILPIIATLIFVTSNYSRRGYSSAIITGAVLGLSVTAIQMTTPAMVEKNPSMFWMTLIPVLACLVLYFAARAKVR